MPLPNRSSASTFDAINKVNNVSVPPANQATDWDNTKLGPGVGDVAALGLTAPRIWLRITLAATTGGLLLLNWQAVWGNVTITQPILTRVGTGNITITLPTVVSDEYDASLGTTNNITVNLNAAQASLEGGSSFGIINASASGNVITIYTASAGSEPSLYDFVGSNLFVVGY